MRYEKVEQIGCHRRQCRGMYDLLREYARAGISLCLEGKEAEPGQIAATCLREGVSYMMDFIPEETEQQKITKIDFNRVDLDEDPGSDTPAGPGDVPGPGNSPGTPPAKGKPSGKGDRSKVAVLYTSQRSIRQS